MKASSGSMTIQIKVTVLHSWISAMKVPLGFDNNIMFIVQVTAISLSICLDLWNPLQVFLVCSK